MRPFLIILLLFTLSFTAVSGQEVKKKMGEVAEITLPKEPKTKVAGNDSMLYVLAPQANYFANVHSFPGKNFKLSKDSLEAFYQGGIKGALEASKGKLVAQRYLTVDGFKEIEFKYIATNNPDLANVRYQRLIFLNKKLYSYSYWAYDDHTENYQAEKDRFLNSFRITGNKNNIRQYTYTKPNVKYLVGIALGCIVVITLLIILLKLTLDHFAKKRRTAM